MKILSVFSASFGVLCVCALAAQAQQLYKCTLANSRVQYQQEPCTNAAKQSTVRPPDPIAPKSDAEQKSASDKSAAAAELQMSQVVVTSANASMCSSDAPGWDAKYSAALATWKSRNGAQVAKFDADAEARAKAIAFIESERARYATNKPGLAATCEAFGARLAPAAAPAAPAK
ncbi:MAG: hypothetical protein ABIR98_00825 [Usitatibacter sp.]